MIPPATCTAQILLSSLPDETLKRMYSPKGKFKTLTGNSLRSWVGLKKTVAEVRKKNLAYDQEEDFPGVCCIAAPIRNLRKDTIAAISISIPTIRMTPSPRPLPPCGGKTIVGIT